MINSQSHNSSPSPSFAKPSYFLFIIKRECSAVIAHYVVDTTLQILANRGDLRPEINFQNTGTRTRDISIKMLPECATIALHPKVRTLFSRIVNSKQTFLFALRPSIDEF